MSWTSSNPVSIGDPTKKAHYDALWDNALYLMSPFTAAGKMAYATGANAVAGLTIGPAYYRMAVNAAGTAPQWMTSSLSTTTRLMDAETTGAGEASINIVSGANCVLIIGMITGGSVSIGMATRPGNQYAVYNYGAVDWAAQLRLVFMYEASGKSQDFAITAWNEATLSGTWTRTGATAAGTAYLYIMSW